MQSRSTTPLVPFDVTDHNGVHLSCISKGNKMSKLLPSFVGLAFGFLFLPGLAPADEAGPIAASCAQRDLQATTMIETHGATQDVAARGLYGAAVAQQLARSACREGHTNEALALYDLILTVGPTSTVGMVSD